MTWGDDDDPPTAIDLAELRHWEIVIEERIRVAEERATAIEHALTSELQHHRDDLHELTRLHRRVLRAAAAALEAAAADDETTS